MGVRSYTKSEVNALVAGAVAAIDLTAYGQKAGTNNWTGLNSYSQPVSFVNTSGPPGSPRIFSPYTNTLQIEDQAGDAANLIVLGDLDVLGYTHSGSLAVDADAVVGGTVTTNTVAAETGDTFRLIRGDGVTFMEVASPGDVTFPSYGVNANALYLFNGLLHGATGYPLKMYVDGASQPVVIGGSGSEAVTTGNSVEVRSPAYFSETVKIKALQITVDVFDNVAFKNFDSAFGTNMAFAAGTGGYSFYEGSSTPVAILGKTDGLRLVTASKIRFAEDYGSTGHGTVQADNKLFAYSLNSLPVVIGAASTTETSDIVELAKAVKFRHASGSPRLFPSAANTLALDDGSGGAANLAVTGTGTFVGNLTVIDTPNDLRLLMNSFPAMGGAAIASVNADNSAVRPLSINPYGGNVGIGMLGAAPTYRLHVNGDGYFENAVTAYSFTGDGSGLTNLPTPPPTAPAGSNTQVQFNSSGAFGASAGLTFDGTSLSIGESGSFVNVQAGVRVNSIQVLGLQQASIFNPSGVGVAVAEDLEARAAIDSILNAMRTHGLIATAV